jgi:O-antigen/teichoic acid export membrane protein
MNSPNTRSSGSGDNTRTVARNSFWYGLELLFSFGAAFLTSVAVARVVGPARLSYYSIVVLLTNVTISVGSFGLPVTTRKYMAEYLNRGDAGVARAIYLTTLKIQVLISVGVSAVLLAWVLGWGAPAYLVASLFLVAAMAPRIVGTIPSQANNAAETMRRNTVPALIGGVVTTAMTILALVVCRGNASAARHNWDLVGVSAAVFAGSLLECGLKLRSVELWLGGVAPEAFAPELKKRMFAYSGQGLALLLLNIVVWDKSDTLFLQFLNADKNQVTFFSISFNLVEKILMIPVSFGMSLSATMMAQFGRGQARLKEMTVDGARYAFLVSLPLLAGMACVAPLVPVLYGEKYRPMVATLAIVAVMAIPKALVAAPTMLLQATERQGFLIVWGCLCGAVDMGLDILLIPHHGANGAAIANGTAQTLAALGIWIYAWKADALDLKLGDSGRIAASGAMMALGVLATVRALPGVVGLFVSIGVGAALWFIGLRATAALKPEDVSRVLSLGGQFPAPVRPHWKRLIAWLAPGGNFDL